MMRPPRLAAAGLGLLLLAGCGSGSQTTTAGAGAGSTVVALTAPAVKGTALPGHTLNGVLTVMMSDDIAKGAACQPPAPYEDLTAGAPVVVKNPAGNEIGRGTLDAGRASTETLGPTTSNCEFRFQVEALPDSESYTVTVNHVKDQTLTAAELEEQAWMVEFGLAMAVGG